MRHLTLTEYKTTEGIHLELSEIRLLRSIAPFLTITPSQLGSSRYDLTPDSRVGAVQLDDLAIEIRPKIPIDRLLFLVSYAVDPKKWQSKDFEFEQRSGLLEAIIPAFIVQVRRAFRRGLLQDYRVREDALPGVRGRLRFEDQIRNRYGIFPPAEVRFDEFTEDIESNRLIKAATTQLLRIRIRSKELQRSLKGLEFSLSKITSVEYDRWRLPSIEYNRLNEHYRPAVELAKRILKSVSFELQHGNVRASSFLLNMNDVFEDFVVIALREALGLSEKTFPQNVRGKYLVLDQNKKIKLEPDLSWWKGKSCLFVGDVKYKRIAVAGIKHPDLYQMLAYTVASDLPVGLLIYAAGESEPIIHDVFHLGKRLEVITLDLTDTPAEILSRIDSLAKRIRAIKQEVSLPPASWALRNSAAPRDQQRGQ